MDKVETKTITISGVPIPLLNWINDQRQKEEPPDKISKFIVRTLYAAKNRIEGKP